MYWTTTENLAIEGFFPKVDDVELLQFLFAAVLWVSYHLHLKYLQNLSIHTKYGSNSNRHEKCFDKSGLPMSQDFQDNQDLVRI